MLPDIPSIIKSKKILVTGGAGFIGVNLLKRLLELGAGNSIRATLYRRPGAVDDKRIEYVKCDLLSMDDCRRVAADVDYVFMCAANTSGAKVIANNPITHLTPNVIMNMNMLNACYEKEVKKFLFISSNVVYPLSDTPVLESDVNNQFYESYHIVGWMKRFTEIVCDMYANKIKRPMKTVVVRPGNLYGPHDKFDWEKSKVIPALIRRAVERHCPFEVWGDGMDLKDFLYIDDYIDGMLMAMETMETCQPINIASGVPVTIRQVLSAILEVADFEDADVQYDPLKPTMIPKRLIDISLAKKKLCWEPQISLNEGIRRTLCWYVKAFSDQTPEEFDLLTG